jgi:hypothetical protein
MSTAQTILKEIEAFILKHDIAHSEFGKMAVEDGHLIRYLRNGGGIGAFRIDRLRKFMAEFDATKQRRVRRRRRQASQGERAA